MQISTQIRNPLISINSTHSLVMMLPVCEAVQLDYNLIVPGYTDVMQERAASRLGGQVFLMKDLTPNSTVFLLYLRSFSEDLR